MGTDISYLTSQTVLETANNPTIKYGGRSSSSALNTIGNNTRADILAIATRLDDITTDMALLQQLMSVQAAALQSQVSSLTSSISQAISAMVDSDTLYVDMYSDSLVTEDSTANINTVYGQATLGVRAEQDKLVYVDTEGSVWIPDASSIKYRYTLSTAARSTSKSAYKSGVNYTYALDKRDDTTWAQTRTNLATQEDIWIYVQVPIETLTEAYANTLILHPFPVFTHNLKGAWYCDYNGTWRSIDLSYQPGYVVDTSLESGGRVDAFGNTRLFFEPAYVSAVILHIGGNAAQATWGFTAIELKMLDFMPSSTLEVDLSTVIPAGATLSPSSTVLHGKYPAELAQLPLTIDDKVLSYAIEQHVSGVSPVVVGIETSWV
jgi:hypothetical protein